jgi:short-subunit dehydrogenase
MKVLRGKVAVITGAASGIGKGLSKELSKEGCHLVLVDIDPKSLAEVAKMVKGGSGKIMTEVIDVADRDKVHEFAEKVIMEYGQVDLVINNAGVALRGTLEEVSYEEFEWLMGINFWGAVYGSKAFLPYLKQQAEGHLVNIASMHGIFTNSGVGSYSSSKFGIRGFTMALCQELRGTSVKVSCVYPGGIKTNIVLNARDAVNAIPEKTKEEAHEAFTKIIAGTSADKAAKKIIRGIKKDKTRILVGPDAYVFDIMTRLFPVYWQKFMGIFSGFLSRLGSEKNK